MRYGEVQADELLRCPLCGGLLHETTCENPVCDYHLHPVDPEELLALEEEAHAYD